MALVSISPVPASVTWDPRGAQPIRVRFGDRELRVTEMRAVRDERAAFPAGSSPRLTVVVAVESGDALELVFDARHHRWYVDALEAA